MNTPPPKTDLDPDDIARVIDDSWRLDVGPMTYLPLGFGSHHWLVTVRDAREQALFVTADRVAAGSAEAHKLSGALRTAWHLRQRAGIAAVVAPMPTITGEIVVPVNAAWVVALYPHVNVRTSEWGAFASADDQRRAQELVGQVHSVDPSVMPANVLPVEDFVIPFRDELFVRLADLAGRWDAGPYAERTRMILVTNAERIRAGFAHYDGLVDQAKVSRGQWVITHGEPHAGNIIRRSDGEDMVMVDWDTCALAPRERDLWQLRQRIDEPETDLGAYLDSTDMVQEEISRACLALYRLRWDLAEIAVYANDFFNEHQDSEDSRVGWGGLNSSIELLAHHLR